MMPTRRSPRVTGRQLTPLRCILPKKSVIPRMGMPRARATMACPSSWSTMHPKNERAVTRPMTQYSNGVSSWVAAEK